ncbi:zinc finger BED domain-containing protein RICESLEEPER 2-like protein [Tanacetum coccineum]|uniref:Zinc finger BED domain-containing protein RICESLEEPER 2-like protein n=1 Tax=Tanacetum coccineum TaxID=301880 RepID=A0ABQ5A433_9ASTR
MLEFNRSLDYKALGVSTIEDIIGMMGKEYVLWFEEGESREKYVMSARMVEMRRKLYLKHEDHFNEKLAYDYYGLTRGLEELYEILNDILVVEVANPSRKAYISYFNWLPEKLRVAVLVSKAAFHFLKVAWVQPETDDYTVADEVKSAGFDICADEVGVKSHCIRGDGIAKKLKTSTSDRLSTEGLRRRQELFGINKFAETAQKSFWVFVWESLHDMTLMVLGSCAFLSSIVGIATEGWPKGAHDGLGIAARDQVPADGLFISGFALSNSTIMDTGDVHPMNIDEESDDSVEEIGNPTQSEGVASTSRPKKQKRKLSLCVWNYFQLIDQDPKKPDQPLQCRCKKCSKIYSAESSSGTGNLKRHLEKCLNSTTRDIGQYMISYNKGVLDTRNAKFSQEKFRELLVHAVARHDLPFSFTKYEGVRDVFKYLEPDVTHITRNTTKADMLKLHGVESKRLRHELLSCPSKICLTFNAWTSIVTDSYLSLIAHYVDKN